MGTNVDIFSKEVIATAPDKDLVTFHRVVTLTLLSRIIPKTPVDTGFARANWQTSVEQPIETITGVDNDVFAQAQASLAGLKPFGVSYISNNVEYIPYLEEGTSSQAPLGMLAVSVEEIKSLFPQ